MNAVIIIFMVVYAILGGLSTLALTLGMPAVILWKFYRKIKYHIALTD